MRQASRRKKRMNVDRTLLRKTQTAIETMCAVSVQTERAFHTQSWHVQTRCFSHVYNQSCGCDQ